MQITFSIVVAAIAIQGPNVVGGAESTKKAGHHSLFDVRDAKGRPSYQ